MYRTYHASPATSIPALAEMATLALLVFVVLELILIAVARKLSPDDAGTPQDERERLFAFRAARVAYVVLIALVIAVTFPMIHLEGGNWGWGMLYLATILVAEIVRAAVLIVQYRRGY